MKKLYSILSVLALMSMLTFVGCNKDVPVGPDEQKAGDNTYIIALDLSAGNSIQSTIPVKDQITGFLAKYRIAAEKVDFIYEAALTGFAAQLTVDQLDALRADKTVVLIEKDAEWTLDIPYLSIHEGILGKNTIQTESTPWGITTVGGSGTARSNVKVWIIDTGIDLDHSDLNVSKNLSKSFVSGIKSADDGNGHGSHCAGIIGAIDNDLGVIGVAPGVQLVAVKVLGNNGSGTTKAILAGLDYVARNAATGDVVNMSLGYSGVVSSVDQAVYNTSVYNGKNIYISIAAGNSSTNTSNTTPARIGLYYNTTLTSNIVSVSACNSSLAFASFSNYGTPVEWCAPGVSIYSCWRNNGYETISGTSMAAPHVAGIMACNGGPSSINYSRDNNNNIIYVSNDPDGTADPIAHR
jgi:subtilisin family serine protease